MTSWTMERACVAAYWRALNQVVKRSLIAVNFEFSKSLNRGRLWMSTIYRFYRVCNIGRDACVNGETRIIGTVLGIDFAAVSTRKTMGQP